MKNIEEYCLKSRKDWRDWLEQNHKKTNAIWLIFHRKNTPDFNLSWSESVDEALCFGWIDSTKKTIDDKRYKQYFCKRKEKSNWSKVNKKKVKTLIEQGLMMEAGYKSIDIAKENGSWTFLDSIEKLTIPDDLDKELAKHSQSSEYFNSLSKSIRKGMLYWVASAKRPETRKRRIKEIVENASLQQRPKHFRN